MAVDGRIRELWILHHATIFGGADRFVLKLARHALATGLPVRIVCEPDSELARRAEPMGIEVVAARYHGFRPPPLLRAPGTLRALHRLLRAPSPGVAVVASGPRPQAYGAWSRPGARLVHLAHEQDTALRRSARLVLPRTGTVVAVGSNSARAYEAALGMPVRAVNNILDAEELAEGADSRMHEPRRDGSPPRLGALVRLIPEKGVVELVDELAAWPGSWMQLRVGALPQDTAYARAVEERIAARGLEERIQLVGPVSDVPGFLDEVDVLVVPSIGHEGQPTTILEALAHGRGVILRRSIWSEDYAGLPVSAYDDERDFGPALDGLSPEAAPLAELERRFGPAQALDGVLEAAVRVGRAG
jgi:glycosyltransferase involved in cell wall biosynthesis